ncbi:MAG: leucine-rich repeat domain-containing protein, partial [archaeon]|nr:leucine-rich repeat domain-containing protein [archaeon]
MITLPVIQNDEQQRFPPQFQICNSQKSNKTYDYFANKVPRVVVENLCRLDRDERYLYFLKFGHLRRYEGDGDVIYVEIPQIPKNLVVYRRSCARKKCVDKLYLNKKDLPQIPLLEGEENLKLLSLESNLISKIEHLVSLNNLLFLNLYENRISEIEGLENVPKLKALMLGKNYIEKIKNLTFLQDLEVLDLHSNKIKIIQGLQNLKKLRILNLANNQITSFVDLLINRNLEELNLRKNLIVSIPNLTGNFEKLKKINLGKNMIAKIDFLMEFKKTKHLQEISLEDNPIIFLKGSYEKLQFLPLAKKDKLRPQIMNEENNKEKMEKEGSNKNFLLSNSNFSLMKKLKESPLDSKVSQDLKSSLGNFSQNSTKIKYKDQNKSGEGKGFRLSMSIGNTKNNNMRNKILGSDTQIVFQNKNSDNLPYVPGHTPPTANINSPIKDNINCSMDPGISSNISSTSKSVYNESLTATPSKSVSTSVPISDNSPSNVQSVVLKIVNSDSITDKKRNEILNNIKAEWEK